MRRPAVAGLFYPADPAELRIQVETELESAVATPCTSLRALVCPHAGYVYSGPIAATSYRVLREQLQRGRIIERVVVLCPAHRVAFRGIAIPDCRAFSTPLGEVPLWSGCKELGQKAPFLIDSRPHAEEHAIEVQLPFLQCILGQFQLIPLVFGAHVPVEPTEQLCQLADERTLFVVSTDLSHYLPYDQARRVDETTLQHFLALSAEEVAEDEACGRSPAAAMLTVARKLGWKIDLLDYRNSGDTAGDKSRVVGYAALTMSDKGS